MKARYFAYTPLAASLIALAGIASTAAASEMPKRKPGLWEISVSAQGMPSMGPMQQCIDRNTDNLMQQEAERSKPDCNVMDVRQSGGKVTIHTVCKIEGTTATTDGVFEGSFETAYKGSLKTRFDPPMHGMSESNVTTWTSPVPSPPRAASRSLSFMSPQTARAL